MVQMKTPGVYIVEKNAFPNSVVQVATAVPAFVGYTQRAGPGNRDLHLTPARINSMAEFEHGFGGRTTHQFEVMPAAEITGDATLPPAGFTVAAGGDSADQWRLFQSGKDYCLHTALRLYFDNGGGVCYIVSIGQYEGLEAAQQEITSAAMIAGINTLIRHEEPTLLVIPETTRLPLAEAITVQQAMLNHCGEKMRNRFALIDINEGYLKQDDPVGTDPVKTFRNSIGADHLGFGATYYPWVETTAFSSRDFSFENITNRSVFAALLQQDIDAENKTAGNQVFPAALNDVARMIAEKPTLQAVDGAPEVCPEVCNDEILRVACPLYERVMSALAVRSSILSPGALMAGVYEKVDSRRGVWKAPANVALQSVVRPVLQVSHTDQENLNVSTDGKSVNAIRPFVGEGTLVWGARTLDGNSPQRRYINVRRTLIMMEESMRRACQAYVFEPNIKNTWVSMRSMMENFLTSIWKQGGLAGSVPEDGFSVRIGLGETMMPTDILTGILRVTVLLAITRPAEFIEVTFQQRMQKS